MTLEEFLSQTEIQSLSAKDAAQRARDYEVSKVWRINTQERKIAVLTRLIIENTHTRLSDAMNNTDNPLALRELARQLHEALSKDLLMNPDYYINLGDTEVSNGYAMAVSFGLLTATELAAFTKAATHISNPFSNITTVDVLKFRGEMVYTKVLNPQIDKKYVKLEFDVSQSTNFEEHTPSLYIKVHNDYKRISSVEKPVTGTGEYKAYVNNHRELWVDNAYNAYKQMV